MISYVNGKYVPHEEAKISVDDRGLLLGDSVYDVARTYGGKPFRLEEHFDRLCKSLRFVELDGEKIVEEVRPATLEIIERNRDLIAADGDMWVDNIITRGCPEFRDSAADGGGATAMLDPVMKPTVIVKLRRLKFALYGPLYERGVDLNVSLLTRHFAGAMDPRVKAGNRLAATRAELKGWRARRDGGTHYTLILSDDGSLAETAESNLFIVTGNTIVRSPAHEVVDGVSVNMACELAIGLGMEVDYRPIRLYDVLNADEVMISATSFGILPVNSVDGIEVRRPRTTYSKILEAWIKAVDFDFVAQAQERARAATG